MNKILLEKASYLSFEEQHHLRRAILFAKQAHDGQYRQTEEPYINHPFAVTEILLTYKADIVTLIAALLHDVVEDTPYSLKQVQSLFGNTVSYIVDGLTKEEKKHGQEKELYNAMNLKKFLIASQKDIRVVMIKVIDRLHNIHTLSVKKPAKQVAYANETLKLFAPLAKKLGLSHIQHELENISFQYLHKEKHKKMQHFLNGYIPTMQDAIKDIQEKMIDFQDATLSLEIDYTFTPIYSAYSQFQETQDFSKLSQIYITTDSVIDCYKILGIIHQLYTPHMHAFEDNIALKNTLFNTYLKTKVEVNDNWQIIYIQTKTAQLKRNHGIFSLIQNNHENIQNLSYTIMHDVIMNNGVLTEDPLAFQSFVSYELFENTITAYTTNLHPIYLPEGATIIDFAFNAFPELAYYMDEAQQNGIKVPFTKTISHLDIIELHFTSTKNASVHWLNYAHTAKAQLFLQNKRL
ncbi:HD domain-containing protein [Bacillus cytotoxicus]